MSDSSTQTHRLSKFPEIIFENESLVAINKPAGLLSIPDREGKDISLKVMLMEKYGSIFTIHRLDRETSGVIVFAKDEATHRHLSKAFEERNVEKYYVGIVSGLLTEKEKIIEAPIAEHPGKRGIMVVNRKGKTAVTEYVVKEEIGKYSFLQFRIHTGRTHQIRVHMQYVGHPIICDPIYGNPEPIYISSLKREYKLSKNELEERPILNRLALHAERLRFITENGEAIELEAPLHKDMRATLQQMRKLAV